MRSISAAEPGRASRARSQGFPEQRARFELRMVAGLPLTTSDGLPLGEQGEIVDVVVPYVTSFFENSR
jgi:hypothetical protein